jgi:hypothetical protein
VEYKELTPGTIKGLGKETQFIQEEPPFIFEDYLDGDSMESDLCFTVSGELKDALEKSKYTGFMFENIETTKNAGLNNNFHHWMKINGQENKDDVYINKDNLRLMLSTNLFKWMQDNFTVKYIPYNRVDIDDIMNWIREP